MSPEDNIRWIQFTDEVEKAASPNFPKGLTGAMVGAATNMAFIVVRKGYMKALAEIPDRWIPVSKKEI